MNNFKLEYSYNGITKDITGITSNYKRSDNLQSLGEDFSFDLLNNPIDKYFDGNVLELGGKITFQNNGVLVYIGILKDMKRNGLAGYSYTAYDYGYYLNKDEVFIQFNKCSCSDALQKICEAKSIPIGTIVDIPVVIQKIYNGSTISDAIKDILKIATENNGKKYRLEVRGGKLFIEDYQSLIVQATYKPAPNLSKFDSTIVPSDFSASYSIEDMATKVVVISSQEKDTQILATATSGKTSTFGELVHYEKVDEKKKGEAQNIADTKLKEMSVVKKEKQVKLFGDDNVRSGRTLVFNQPLLDMVGNFLVVNCSHEYSNINHFMTLQLKKEGE